jgi:bifunctional UDP-N-acetylglucosamine pyrophosphorylase/glucosamine-1-phosphate N-acetyltransferase
MKALRAVVLAAGKGTRMKSQTPKVLFPLAGKSILQHVVDTLTDSGVEDIYIVVGYGSDMVQEAVTGPITWVLQREQLGTGHALLQAAPHLRGTDTLLVVTGDTPLLTSQTISDLISLHQRENHAATVLTARVPDPGGYGRILRAGDQVKAIIEDKDASPEERAIAEINSGVFCYNWARVEPLLARLTPNNRQGEYYLTDIMSMLFQEGRKTGAFVARDYQEVAGINNRVQLAWAEGIMRARINEALMLSGVSMQDPGSVWIDAGVEIGQDTVILPNTHIYGATKIGSNCTIGPDAMLRSCQLEEGVAFHHAVAEECVIGQGTRVGPFAYIRPGSVIGSGVKVGDFVEIKNSRIGDGSKVPHLAYVGDAKVGTNTNIGCGVITANYDGKKKSVTEIGNDAFIGSNCNLVAPVKVGDGAYVAAGSTITDEVPPRALAIARSRQTVKVDWRKKD